MSENYLNKTVCVCVCVCTMQWQFRCDRRLRQPCCVMHAHSNTAIQLKTCTKLVLNLLSVLSKLISIYATMQCNEIANQTNIFKWRDKKNIEWQVNISMTNCLHFFLFASIYCSLCLFFFNDQVAEGGGKCLPLHPPGYGYEFCAYNPSSACYGANG